jgi:hypothetical protein
VKSKRDVAQSLPKSLQTFERRANFRLVSMNAMHAKMRLLWISRS